MKKVLLLLIFSSIIDKTCITYGYTIGGSNESWKKFSPQFKKFFVKNLLN